MPACEVCLQNTHMCSKEVTSFVDGSSQEINIYLQAVNTEDCSVENMTFETGG